MNKKRLYFYKFYSIIIEESIVFLNGGGFAVIY